MYLLLITFEHYLTSSVLTVFNVFNLQRQIISVYLAKTKKLLVRKLNLVKLKFSLQYTSTKFS